MDRAFRITSYLLGPLFFLILTSCGPGRQQVFARRWGFIDKTGAWVIKPQFLQTGDFSEGLAPAQVATAKWGFIDRQGNFVIPPQFANVAAFKEGLACVEVNHKIGYLDKTGKMVIPAIYVNAGSFSEGLAEVTLNWSSKGPGFDAQVGYIDKTGRMVIEPRFWDYSAPAWDHFGRYKETIPYHGDFSEGLAGLVLSRDQRGDHRGYIDRHGNVVLQLPNAVRVGPFSEGLAMVSLNWKQGFIDRSGKFVIQPGFDWTSWEHVFSEGLAALAVGGKLGFMDRSGKTVIAPQFDWVTNFSEGRAIVQMYGSDPIFIDKTGRHIFEAFRVHADVFSDGLAAAPMRTWSGLFELLPYAFFPSGRPRWGFINEAGQTVIQPQFDDAHSFSEGLAAVAKFGWFDY
jgi:hypothetical protein